MSVWMCASVCYVLDTEGVYLAQRRWVKHSSSLPRLPHSLFLSTDTMERLETWWLEGLLRYVDINHRRSTHTSSLLATTISDPWFTCNLIITHVPSVVWIIPHWFPGAAKALESGNIFSSGLCSTSLLRQSPWRCVGESCCHGDHKALCQEPGLYLVSFSGYHAQQH